MCRRCVTPVLSLIKPLKQVKPPRQVVACKGLVLLWCLIGSLIIFLSPSAWATEPPVLTLEHAKDFSRPLTVQLQSSIEAALNPLGSQIELVLTRPLRYQWAVLPQGTVLKTHVSPNNPKALNRSLPAIGKYHLLQLTLDQWELPKQDRSKTSSQGLQTPLWFKHIDPNQLKPTRLLKGVFQPGTQLAMLCPDAHTLPMLGDDVQLYIEPQTLWDLFLTVSHPAYTQSFQPAISAAQYP